jgi:hypothetical protein
LQEDTKTNEFKVKIMSLHMQHNFFKHHVSSGLSTEIWSSLAPHSDLMNSLKLNKSSSGGHARVVPPTHSVDGKSQAAWQDFWWKTLDTEYGTADNPDPVTDDNDFRKTGSVQMLAGTDLSDNNPRVRDIQVDDQTYLFSPIITFRVDNAGFPPDWNEANSRDFIRILINAINPKTDLFYEVDGKSLINGAAWKQYRQQSPAYYNYQKGGVGATIDYATTDGYVVMLNPLSAGTHTIHFGGSIDLSNIVVEDLNKDGILGTPPGITESTSEQFIEDYLKSYQADGSTLTVDVTYNVQVTHSCITPSSLDLSALATV